MFPRRRRRICPSRRIGDRCPRVAQRWTLTTSFRRQGRQRVCLKTARCAGTCGRVSGIIGLTPSLITQSRLHSSSGQRKRWKDNSALDASFCSDSYSPMRSAEFLNRDLEDEIRATNSKSDKEKAYIYKKRYMDTYGFAVGLARHLEHLQRVQADRRDEIEVLKAKIKTQDRIIDTITDHDVRNGHHTEKRIQALCREVAMMSRHLAERDGYIENLQHEREESVRTMNRLKLSHAACQSGNCASSTASQSYSSVESIEVQALQEKLAAVTREKDQAVAEVSSWKTQYNTLENTCNRLKAERATCADAVKRSEEQMDALRNCFEKGKYDVEMTGRRVSELTTERDELRTKLDSLQLNHRVSTENEKRYLDMLTSQHAAVDEARQRIHVLENELVETKRRLAELSEKAQHVTLLDRELSQTKNELAAAQSRIHMLEQQAHVAKKELNDLEARHHEREVMLETRIYQGELVRRSLHNKVMELKGNIRVFCRVRPVLLHEEASFGEDIFAFPDYSGERRIIELQACPRSHQGYGQNGSKDTVKKYQFDFDMVFDGGCTQEELFLEVSALVQSALDGYNVCIFAYGQTGSGKTYTMQGVEEDPINAPAHRGIVGRGLSHIFATIADLRSSSWDFTVSLEMTEIYNETLRDLLAAPGSTDKVDLRLDADGKPTVVNSCVHRVKDEFEALKLLQKAMSRRATKMTNMNDRSSRSHCVITLRLNGVNGLNGERRNGVVHLVDLAGSERLSKSGSGNDRETMKETQSINKSLSSLGNVIGALAKKSAHVPFRDSKLTHFLSPSLGGDSKTLMICNLSPLPQHRDESLNSLRFAKTANSCEIAFPSFSNRS
ncbi:TPA: hypothetical protein N0F65_001953 [Lagenidium giganteum]|uniref:Kinesin-like protein n=1 Tax=Lagenidium giganteum TaxID=4803 RepID=A0AAV2YQ75_9STRA|nr:TPA: hypothetical protein N0F65_001953 [Lagenidium giganteum]